MVSTWNAKGVVGGRPSPDWKGSGLARVTSGTGRPLKLLYGLLYRSNVICKSKENSYIIRVCNDGDRFGVRPYTYSWKALFQHGEEGMKAQSV